MLKFLNPVSVRLDKNEMQMLEDVYDGVKNEILYTGQYGIKIDEKVFEQIIEVTDDLIRITENLNQCLNTKRQFLKNYPRFSKVRDKNLKALGKLGNSLNLDRKNSNIARLFGNLTTFVGGILVVSSAVLSVVTLEVAVPLAIAGGAVVAAGSATSAGTSITELILGKNKVETAKTIIEEDKKAIGDLISWLSPACELAESLDRINNIDFVQDMKEILPKYMQEVIQIKHGEKRSTAIKMLVKAAIMCLPAKIKTGAEYAATLISMLSAIIMLHERNQLLFDCASLIFKGDLGGSSCAVSYDVDCGLTAARMVSVNAEGRNVGKAVPRDSLAVFNMTLDAASIVLTSIDVHRESQSKGKQVIELAEKLREQGDVLRKVFAALL